MWISIMAYVEKWHVKNVKLYQSIGVKLTCTEREILSQYTRKTDMYAMRKSITV